MSIVKLHKATLCGLRSEKDQVLSDLQELGCLHIIPLADGGRGMDGPSNSRAREALKYLESCPQQRRQVKLSRRFDAERVEFAVLGIKEKIQNLEDERDFLLFRIGEVQPFGYFEYPPLEELDRHRLWFYVLNHYRLKDMPEDVPWSIVNRDQRHTYIVVISPEEPTDIPGQRARVGSKSLNELEKRLEEVEIVIDELQAERYSLTRWRELFEKNVNRLEDYESLRKVARQTFETEELFALQAWLPTEKSAELREYALKERLALTLEEPQEDELPPTLLDNPPTLASGENLLTFYMTPNYWLSDPSVVIFFSFILFFAMIMSDAGYGILLCIIALLYWKKMGLSENGRKLRILFGALAVATVVWGILVGSFFGYTPPEGSLLSHVHVLELQNFDGMMKLTILIGAGQVMVGNAISAWQKRGSLAMLAPLGWILVILGALVLGFGGGTGTLWGDFGIGLMSAGGAAILLFAGAGESYGKRLFAGLKDLTRITSAFGDVLSYLRLFALGLASSSLAIAFNGLASQAYESTPGLGLLFAILILLIGHGLNFILALVSSVVHGLRLNLIEFLNWSIPEEGKPFRAFRKK